MFIHCACFRFRKDMIVVANPFSGELLEKAFKDFNLGYDLVKKQIIRAL